MESLNIHKGYAKIGPLESQHQPPSYIHSCRRAILIAVSSLLLLTLLLLSLIAALVHESTDSDHDDNEPFDPIRYTCNVTQHREACIASISAINNHPTPNPTLILSLLLRSTTAELGDHLVLPKTLISNTRDDHRTVIALEDCGSLLNDAYRSLNASAAKVEAKTEEWLTESELGDVRTWISAAMTDQDTCVDGLEEVGAASAVVAEVRRAVQGATVGMSNTLAILANMDRLKTGMLKMCHQTKH